MGMGLESKEVKETHRERSGCFSVCVVVVWGILRLRSQKLQL